jgi:hypothetical protein
MPNLHILALLLASTGTQAVTYVQKSCGKSPIDQTQLTIYCLPKKPNSIVDTIQRNAEAIILKYANTNSFVPAEAFNPDGGLSISFDGKSSLNVSLSF